FDRGEYSLERGDAPATGDAGAHVGHPPRDHPGPPPLPSQGGAALDHDVEKPTRGQGTARGHRVRPPVALHQNQLTTREVPLRGGHDQWRPLPETTVRRWIVVPEDDDRHRLGAPVAGETNVQAGIIGDEGDRKSTRLNSSHVKISYAVFCLKKKNNKTKDTTDS